MELQVYSANSGSYYFRKRLGNFENKLKVFGQDTLEPRDLFVGRGYYCPVELVELYLRELNLPLKTTFSIISANDRLVSLDVEDLNSLMKDLSVKLDQSYHLELKKTKDYEQVFAKSSQQVYLGLKKLVVRKMNLKTLKNRHELL